MKVLKKDNLSVENLSRRITADTPPYWKKWQLIGLVLIGVGTAILAPVTAGVSVPISVTILGSIFGTAGGTIVSLAQTASVENYVDLDKMLDEKKITVDEYFRLKNKLR